MQDESVVLEHQAVEVYGQSASTAYTRMIATREVIFTCVRCKQEQQERRYPGPIPKYCPVCRQQVIEEREERRIQQQRERRQAEATQRRQRKTP